MASSIFHPSTRKFFLYGLVIAELEEFITQGALKGAYFRACGRSTPFVSRDSAP